MSRISQGKIELKKERIELASLVHHPPALQGHGFIIKALEAGADRAFANEIDARQLVIIRLRTPAKYANKLV